MSFPKVTVGELPAITGRIMNACAQDKDMGIEGDDVFSSFSAGGSGRPSSSTYDAKADSDRVRPPPVAG